MKIIPILTIPKSSGVSTLVRTVIIRRTRSNTRSWDAPMYVMFLTVLDCRLDNGFGMLSLRMILSVWNDLGRPPNL